ncbi:MAG: FAD-dependent oxidoreductase [Gemmatimonadales bacterium]
MTKRETSRIVIAGAGVAALEVLLTLQDLARRRLEIVLLSPSPHFEYTPLAVAEAFDLGHAHRFDLREILRERGVEIVIGELAGVAAEDRRAETVAGTSIRYDALVVTVGARRRGALPGAITFSGPRASSDVRGLLHDASAGAARQLVFAVPAGITWSLPIYELALMTAAHLAERGVTAEVSVVSPEDRPLAAFGGGASAAVEEMMNGRDIAFHNAVPARVEPGRLVLEDAEPLAADAVVALPKLLAPAISGVPREESGFLPIDEHCRVRGLAGVYAAGDVTSFPLKQGGIATQQADAAGEALLADLGEAIEPAPFRPILRGLLLTGRAPRYLRAEVLRGRSGRSSAASEAIWWPPAKIAGRRLGPFLALQGVPGGPPPDAVALELDGSNPETTQSPDPRR